MSIEPVNSVMTLQAQQVQPKTQPIVQERNDYKGNQSDQTVEAAAMEREGTVVVKKAEQQDGQSNSGSDQQDKDHISLREQQTQQQLKASNEKIKTAIDKINKQLPNSEAIFGVHEETNRVTIKIVNKETKEVIKEIPPEKTLDMIAKAWELAGLLVDERG